METDRSRPAIRRAFFGIRDEGLARNKALYIALGVAAEGAKGVLGSWT
jgi:transposase-like protein